MLQPMSVPASGGAPARPVFGVPGRFIVFDVAGDGRWLAVREDLSLGVRARVPGQDDGARPVVDRIDRRAGAVRATGDGC